MPLPPDVVGLTPERSPRPPLIAVVGRLDKLKAPEVLLSALRLLAPDVPGVRAVFMGQSHRSESPTGGDYAHWLRTEAARLALDVEVRPRGGRAEVLALYREARVVAVPSRFESLSLVALESLACGTPVVVSNATGVAEWISPTCPGSIVPSGDPVALADALRPILLDDDVAFAAGSAGHQLVAQRCTPVAVAAERLALYRKLGVNCDALE